MEGVSHWHPFIRPNLTIVSLDVAQILAGIQVPPQDKDEFESFLKNLGYPYVEETDNIVYKQFLRQ